MSSDKALTLYVDSQFCSPYAMSAFVGLVEKNLPFEIVTLDLDKGEQHAQGFAEQSVTQRLPTLVHGDFTLSESSAITEYLDEVFAGVALYPKELQIKAKARQVQAWIRSDLLPIRQERSTLVVFYEKVHTELSPAARNAVTKLLTAADVLLAHGGENLFGEWSIVDVDLALIINRLVLNGDDVPPHLEKYARHQWTRPSVQQWLKQPRPTLSI